MGEKEAVKHHNTIIDVPITKASLSTSWNAEIDNIIIAQMAVFNVANNLR